MATPTTPPTPTEMPFVEKGTFFGSSIGIVSAGMLLGLYRGLQQEKVKFSLKSHGPPFAAASRALAYGTLLCFGTFTGLTAAFIGITGITSAKEFADSSQKILSKYDSLNYTPEIAREEKEMSKKMTEDEEMEYITKKYFENITDDDSNNSNSSSKKS